jgi:GT2 family glycosyltransferase
MDFMPGYAHAIAVPYTLIPYADTTFHYAEKGLLWADPDIVAAADALRRARDAHDRLRSLVEVGSQAKSL